MLKLEPRDTELIDVVLLGRRQVASNPYKTLARGQLRVDLGGSKGWEDPNKPVGGLGRIDDLFWIGVKRRAVEGRRENVAVAVKDIRMARRRLRNDPEARDLRFGGPASDSHDFDDPQGYHCKD